MRVSVYREDPNSNYSGYSEVFYKPQNGNKTNTLLTGRIVYIKRPRSYGVGSATRTLGRSNVLSVYGAEGSDVNERYSEMMPVYILYGTRSSNFSIGIDDAENRLILTKNKEIVGVPMAPVDLGKKLNGLLFDDDYEKYTNEYQTIYGEIPKSFIKRYNESERFSLVIGGSRGYL